MHSVDQSSQFQWENIANYPKVDGKTSSDDLDFPVNAQHVNRKFQRKVWQWLQFCADKDSSYNITSNKRNRFAYEKIDEDIHVLQVGLQCHRK